MMKIIINLKNVWLKIKTLKKLILNLKRIKINFNNVKLIEKVLMNKK